MPIDHAKRSPPRDEGGAPRKKEEEDEDEEEEDFLSLPSQIRNKAPPLISPPWIRNPPPLLPPLPLIHNRVGPHAAWGNAVAT